MIFEMFEEVSFIDIFILNLLETTTTCGFPLSMPKPFICFEAKIFPNNAGWI